MDAAASMIEKAIIANPTYAEAYNNLGLSLFLLSLSLFLFFFSVFFLIIADLFNLVMFWLLVT